MAEKIVKKVKIVVTDDGSLKNVSKNSQELNRNMKGLSKQSSNASKNFSKTAQGMQGVLVPAYAEVAARVFALTAVYQALNKAADFRILMQGQAEYAKKTGKNMADIAKQVQRASKGMLNFADASSQVALATTSGITSSQIVKMTKAAVDSSTALGRSVQDTMDRLTRGIVKAEPEILDEIGVIIRLDKVYKDYAQSVSKSTQELTEGEKATARYTAIMGQLESKFGGIADKVDPNYMRAAAASVMDILANASTKLVAVVNPILKFLSEAKSAIIVILLVIMKNLAGKVFPAFTKLGGAIAGYPLKMSAAVNKLTADIQLMNKAMAEQKAITRDLGAQIEKSMPAKWRGKEFKAGGDPRRNLRSMGSSLGLAESQMGKGAMIGWGKYEGMTRAQLNVMKLEHKALQKEIGKTHTRAQVWVSEGRLGLAKFNKVMLKTKMLWASAAASATQYFTTTKQLIADQGLFLGTWTAIKSIGYAWQEAAVKAGIYNKTLEATKAITGFVGVMTAFMGAMISKAFGWLIALTMIVSIGKMILDVFGVFDTRFGKAAAAAKTLSEEIKEQKSLFDDRDPKISFEGAAESFDEAMANITFASNFADSLYESTKKAMTVLSKDMQGMGFWDSLLDGLKSLFGRGLIDNMAASAGGTAQMMAEAYPKIAEKMRKKYKVSGDILGSGPEYKKALEDYMSKQTLAGMDFRSAEKFAKEPEGMEFVRRKSMLDKIREIEEDDSIDKYEKQRQLAQITDDYLKLLEVQSKLERARVEDTKALTDAFENLGKAQKKFETGLLTKSGVHDMAVEWKKIDNILGADNLRKSTKLLKLREAGLIEGPTGIQAPWMKGNAKDDAFDYIMEQGGMDFLMENWAEIDAKLMKATTFRLEQERELKELKIFGNSALEEQTQKQKRIADLNLTEKRESLRLLEKNKEATAHDIDQARTKLAIAEKEVEDIGKIALKQAEYRAKLEGRTLTIMEKLAALKKDWGDSPLWGEWKKDEGTAFFTKYIQNLDRSIVKQDKLNLLLANFHALSVGEQGQIRAAQQKALQFSSFAGSGNTFLNHQIINDSMLKGIGENEYKRNRTAELISENPVLKMHKPVIDLYFKVEKLRAKNLDKDLLLQAEKMMLETEYKLALEAELDAKWKERADVFGGAMKTIADGFGNAISSYFNDIFMNKKPEKGAFRTAMAQAFASAGSNMIGNMMQKQVFGRSGLVSGMLKAGGMSDKWLDTLFPKTELELAQERTSLLRDMLLELEELNEKRKITGSVYPGDPNNVVPGGLASLKALANKKLTTSPLGTGITLDSGGGISLDTKQILTNKLVKQLQEESSGTTYGGKTHVWDKTSSFATFGKNLQNGYTPKANYNVRDEYGSGYYGGLAKRLSLADAGIGYAGKPSGPNNPVVVHDEQTFKAFKTYLWEMDIGYSRDADMWGAPSFKRNKGTDNTAALAAIMEEQEVNKALKNLTKSVDNNNHWTQQNTEGFTGWQNTVTKFFGGHGSWNSSMMNMLGGNAQSGFGNWGPGVGSTSSWANKIGTAGGKNDYGIGSMVGDLLLGMLFAKGGIAPGGFRAFANGGIANRPTLGMVGEGRYNEAVVPLPDGRSIPVKGAGSNVTVNVAIDSNGQAKATESSGDGAKELGYLISQAVQSELVDQQRPGGLLSSY